MIGIAHSLDIRVVAEGVESPQQAEKLRDWAASRAGIPVPPAMSPDRCRALLEALRQPVSSETMRVRVMRWAAGSGER